MLAWADSAASIWCQKLSQSKNLITVHMSDIDFLEPVRIGEIVEFFGEEWNIGRSSITVRILVKIVDPVTSITRDAFRFTAVMVNISDDLKPRPLPEHIQQTHSPASGV